MARYRPYRPRGYFPYLLDSLDIIPFIGNIGNISYGIYGRYPLMLDTSLLLYEYRSRFHVGILDGGYLVGEAIVASQLAGRGIPRFISIPILYIFQIRFCTV